MDIWEKVKAVQLMQDYIHESINEKITLEKLAQAAGYSKWHSLRIFKEIFNKTPHGYIKAMRLTRAAHCIRDDKESNANILDVAMQMGFDSHEGFTKAFTGYFGINPSKYRNSVIPMHYMYFEPASILQYYLLLNSEEHKAMGAVQRIVTVTVVEKTARKLVLKRGIKSTDYFGWCAEIGCDKWELMSTITPALDKVSFVELPPHLIAKGTSKAACCVEVPLDFNSGIPDGFDIIEIPAHLMMWFQGAPYENEEWYGEAHTEMYSAIKNYNPELYGYAFDTESAPRFEYGTSAKTGCRVMIPVKRLSEK